MNSICSLCRFVTSSIGKKIIVALTGAALVLFLAGHLVGNLVMYLGEEHFNEYAEFLHSMGHGAGIWVARLGLLGAFVTHILFTVLLVKENKDAKAQTYEKDTYVKANQGSRFMIWSGCTILAFVIYHILHFTIRVAPSSLADVVKEHGPYRMVVQGFDGNWLVVAFYIIAMVCLCSHLSHGVASIFQTIGLRTKKNAMLIDYGAKAYTAFIFFGFISIPIAINIGLIS